MRTFVAIDLPERVKAELLSAQKQMSSASAKLSFVGDFHLTLKFLGELTPAKAEAVKTLLGSVKFKGFTATISGVGVFPSENYVRVVWVGLEPEDNILQLQKSIDCALEKEFPKEKNFKPHLTLARVKFLSDKKQFIGQLRQIKPVRVEFMVDCFKLKESKLSDKGAVYRDLAVYSNAAAN
ncbi:MAG TPA: RNA 2',3'-cyclic phosphodiesterase [Candidatus Nanoarchaeia archaeon]|nr:RNA 2',3'-cyclic phosphodiesterase [Candidatus Nanoarchaeia archaeon]